MRHQTFQVRCRVSPKAAFCYRFYHFIGPPQRITRGVVANNILILSGTTGKNTGINGTAPKIANTPRS